MAAKMSFPLLKALQQMRFGINAAQLIPSTTRGLHLSLSPNSNIKWHDYNKMVSPPQEPGEERRPAWVCHYRDNIKYSPQKMWYIACMIRGMSIDEAIKQLSFLAKKGAPIIKETLLEAQEMAVNEHNVEYKSNLWIAESFVGRGVYIKGIRRHARARWGKVEYRYCHYFVKLKEGPPPKHYYTPEMTGDEKLEDYLSTWRQRRITQGL